MIGASCLRDAKKHIPLPLSFAAGGVSFNHRDVRKIVPHIINNIKLQHPSSTFTIYYDVVGNSLSEHFTNNYKAMTSQELGRQMTGLNINAAIMPDTRRGVKQQLMQKDLPEEATLLWLSQIVKAEHK